MYRLLLGLTLLASCASEFEDSYRDEECTSCDEDLVVIAAAPWLSCWVDSFEPDNDLDPTGALRCNLDSKVAFTGDDRLEGINFASAKARLGDSVKESTWHPGQDSDFLVTGLNPTFDMDFPVTLEMQVNTFGGRKYTQTVTLNGFEDAPADNPAQLFRPYDLWKVEFAVADGVRLMSSKLGRYVLPLPGLAYSERNTAQETMAVSLEALPTDGPVYLPVEPGYQGVLSGFIKTAYKAQDAPREFNEFAFSIPTPGRYTVAKDGVKALGTGGVTAE